MARPTDAPRLRALVPQDVAEEVVRLVTDHATQLLIHLDPSATWSLPGPASLRWTTQLLVSYAQRGLAATDWQRGVAAVDWPHHGAAADALLDVCSALYSCAGRPGDFDLGAIDDEVDPSEPIGVVLLAASARIRIDKRERVPVRELAALAGVDPDHVRLLARRGELELVGGEAKAKEARRWLSGRGVEGL